MEIILYPLALVGAVVIYIVWEAIWTAHFKNLDGSDKRRR